MPSWEGGQKDIVLIILRLQGEKAQLANREGKQSQRCNPLVWSIISGVGLIGPAGQLRALKGPHSALQYHQPAAGANMHGGGRTGGAGWEYELFPRAHRRSWFGETDPWAPSPDISGSISREQSEAGMAEDMGKPGPDEDEFPVPAGSRGEISSNTCIEPLRCPKFARGSAAMQIKRFLKERKLRKQVQDGRDPARS